VTGRVTGSRALRSLLLLAALPLCLGIDLLQSRDKAVEEGNVQMKAGKPEQALGRYDEAVKRLPGDPGVHFNRGAALYGLSRWEEAAQSFLQATEAKAPDLKGAAFYNLGNSFFQAKKYGEAVEAFKKALAYNPGDQRAKWNLELALRNKKDEEKKNQGDKNKDPKDDQKKPDDQKGEQQKADDKDQQAKNEPEKPGDESKGDQQDKQDGENKTKQDQQADQKQQQKPPEQKPQQAQNDPKQPPEDKGQGKPDQQDKQDQKDRPPQASNQPQKGQTGNKGKQPPPDMAEVDAILDNLEKSPKALEQELARVRAMNRRPPAKDW
jgi:Ca-activated chloride channel family protein